MIFTFYLLLNLSMPSSLPPSYLVLWVVIVLIMKIRLLARLRNTPLRHTLAQPTWKSCPVFAWGISCSSHKGAEIASVCRWNLYYWFLAINVHADAVCWNPKAKYELQYQRDTSQFFLLLPFPCTSTYSFYSDFLRRHVHVVFHINMFCILRFSLLF